MKRNEEIVPLEEGSKALQNHRAGTDKPMEHFNKLTPAEHERLTLIFEECSEVIQIVGKIMRHGYNSCHPNGGPTNRQLLEEELGHVMFASNLACENLDLDYDGLILSAENKGDSCQKYLHHNTV